MRVEADCRDDLCMTVLAGVRQADPTPELTLNADTLIGFTDAGVDDRGTSGFPIDVKGRGSTGIRVTPRGGSGVIEACGACVPSAEDLARRPVTPSSPPSPSPTFEEFRHSLGLDP